MKKNPDATRPVAHALPARFTRTDLDDLGSIDVKSDLDLQIVQLLNLHPGKLTMRFRNHDLASLDDTAKKALLAGMNEVLGIRPLVKKRKE